MSELLIEHRRPLLRAAVVSSGRLTDLHIDRVDRDGHIDRDDRDDGHVDRDGQACPRTGSLWLGRVERLVSGINAAFIDLGTGKAGLLGMTDVRLQGGKRPEPGTAIGTLLCGGQAVLVQVKAEAVGAKGPSLAMEVSLPGRFLVHVPFRNGVTVSKRVDPGSARAALTQRLQALTVGNGWIARSGTDAIIDDRLIAAESDMLAAQWRELGRRAATSSAPSLLQPGPDAARRAVIGHGPRPLGKLVVDAPAVWANNFAEWCAVAAPDLVPLIESVALIKRNGAVFERGDVEGQILALTRPLVRLAGGGSLIIEHTQALTAIDVNAGEHGNPLSVNLEAATEIARQLRLRNIGGIVVVDFVSMPRRSDGKRLVDALTAAVRNDPVQTEVYGLSKLGLLELTRARRGPMLAELLLIEAG
ncbi:MAG: ribonuclease E/G [Rhodospirillaceae bacterium]